MWSKALAKIHQLMAEAFLKCTAPLKGKSPVFLPKQTCTLMGVKNVFSPIQRKSSYHLCKTT